MKWNEMSTKQKIVYIILSVCFFAYFALVFLRLVDIAAIPSAVTTMIFATLFLCFGITQKNTTQAKWFYIIAGIEYLLGLAEIFL